VLLLVGHHLDCYVLCESTGVPYLGAEGITMPRRDQRSFAIQSLLYGQRVPYERLPSVCETLLLGDTSELRVKLLLTEAAMVDALTQSRSAGRFASFKRVSPEQVSGEMHLTFARNRTVEGNFTIIKHPRYSVVWVLVTDARGQFLRQLLMKGMRNVHPQPASPILRTEQLESLLQRFASIPRLEDIRVRQVGTKTRIPSEDPRPSVETDRRWTTRAITDIFEGAREQNAWITDLAVDYTLPGRGVGRGYLRVGRFGEYRVGHYATDAFNLIESTCEMAYERYNFLHNRARTRETQYRSRPFVIDFTFPALSSVEDIKRLHGAVTTLPNTASVVLHGNPFYHVAVTDYADGSMFEVVSFSPTYLAVLPQGRATVRSLTALCRAVFSNFQEGALREVDEAAG
jgi:hypothetical protein